MAYRMLPLRDFFWAIIGCERGAGKPRLTEWLWS